MLRLKSLESMLKVQFASSSRRGRSSKMYRGLFNSSNFYHASGTTTQMRGCMMMMSSRMMLPALFAISLCLFSCLWLIPVDPLTFSTYTGMPFTRTSQSPIPCRVLTMEYLEGVSLTDLAAVKQVTDARPDEVLINALNTWFLSLTMCPTFHADVHAGMRISF